MEYLLGIDIGGTHVKGGIVTGTTGKMDHYADIAQEVECVLGKDEVTGSNPVISSKEKILSEFVGNIFFD